MKPQPMTAAGSRSAAAAATSTQPVAARSAAAATARAQPAPSRPATRPRPKPTVVQSGARPATAARTKAASVRSPAPSAAPAAAGGAHQRALRRTAVPTIPRRISGPVARPAVADRPRAPVEAPVLPGSLARRAIARVSTLPDHSLLDRVVRGRAWIPLLGVLLTGIVASQVEVLKLGASLGRSVQLTSTLQASNQALSESVTELGDTQRIEKLATGMGMVMPPANAVTFLTAPGATNIGRALANVHAPNAADFESLQTAQGAVVTQSDLSSLTAALSGGTASAPPTPTSTSTSTAASTSTSSSTSTAASTSTSSSTSTPASTSTGP